MENNHLVIIGGKSLFYKRWYDACVETLSDILKEGKFMSFASFSKKYNVNTNFLHYIGLRNAFLKQWRKAVRGKREDESLPPGELVHKTPLNCKH